MRVVGCPRCGHAGADGPSCPACGVVFAKLRERPPRPVPPPTPRSRGPAILFLALGSALAVLAGLILLRGRRPEPVAPSPEAATVPRADQLPAAEVPPPPTLVPDAPPPTHAPLPSEGLSEDDLRLARDLDLLLQRGATWTDAEILSAEALVGRHPGIDGLRGLLAGGLAQTAGREAAGRKLAAARAHLERAVELRPQEPAFRLQLLQVHLSAGDWPAAEASARELLALTPGDARALRGLGYALLRQDRPREAAEALRASLEIADDPGTRGVLAQVEKGVRDEGGMTNQKLAHFHVRYDGEEHEDVGREVLRALERHYATLVRELDWQPRAPIAVVLFSHEAYYDATGAPRWSAGLFDGFDGRIRVPIAGLTASLPREVDDTLMHELTHAFVQDMTGGSIRLATDLNEGLAQYMEGRRAGLDFSPAQFAAVVEASRAAHPAQCGSRACVAGFYLGALSFVEHLLALRGQGGIRDLLRALGETGSADEAFRRVHGRSHRGLRELWMERLRQRQG